MSLSSANVDEVIKKRILEKNEAGKQTLKLLYEDKATVIKNLIIFNDGVEKKLYVDSENFADIYPLFRINLICLAVCLRLFARTERQANIWPRASGRCWRCLKSQPSR